MKYCKDCKYAEKRVSITGDSVYLKCYHPQTMAIDPVTGPEPYYCETARKLKCGIEEAKYFEEKISYYKQARNYFKNQKDA